MVGGWIDGWITLKWIEIENVTPGISIYSCVCLFFLNQLEETNSILIKFNISCNCNSDWFKGFKNLIGSRNVHVHMVSFHWYKKVVMAPVPVLKIESDRK